LTPTGAQARENALKVNIAPAGSYFLLHSSSQNHSFIFTLNFSPFQPSITDALMIEFSAWAVLCV
jgi:hypothetical protein